MSTFREQLAAKHHFDEWRGQSTSERALLTQGYFLSPWQVPDWHPLRHRVLSPPSGPPKHVVYLSDQKERSDRGMTVSFIECESLEAAHGQLLALLGEFQAPEVSRDLTSPYGDVCFATPSRASALFSRGNLVFLVQKAERATVPVSETASALDRAIVEPRSPSTQGPPEIKVGVDEASTDAGAMRIEASLERPLQRPYWLRFSAAGVANLWMDATGAVHARAKAGSPGTVEVTAYDEHGWSTEGRAVLGESR